MLAPVTPKKNMKAFGGTGAVASSEWYDSKLPNCVDFDKPGMYRLSLSRASNDHDSWQSRSTMLPVRLSFLAGRILLACHPFLCTRSMVGSLIFLLIPLSPFSLRCPPIPRGLQALPRRPQVLLPSKMSCP